MSEDQRTPALPSGVVTFLLTDIEGSSQLWETYGPAMADALVRHDELIAETVAASGGVFIKSKGEGDSTLSVFHRASGAATAALELRRRLAEERWPAKMNLSVRMALHTGEAHEREGDYYGPTLNRAARVRALATGGQVLASAATAELLRDGLPNDTVLADAGHHELRGLGRDEHVFELTPVGSPAPRTRQEISVLIVDDQRLVRAGFGVILRTEPGITVVGEAGDGEEAIELTRRLSPSVVLMDIRMPVMDGLAAARVILAETVSRVLMLTTFDSDEYVYAALRAGASGFLLKDAPSEQLVAAVRSVAAGDALIDPSITRRLIERFVQASRPGSIDPPQVEDLTPRERDVLRQVAQGLSNAEIAARLFVEENTVKTHVGRILMKLHLRDRVQAVVFAYECGFVDRSGS
ncbi:MAG: response regulator [Acidimicrobiales bacterium]